MQKKGRKSQRSDCGVIPPRLARTATTAICLKRITNFGAAIYGCLPIREPRPPRWIASLLRQLKRRFYKTNSCRSKPAMGPKLATCFRHCRSVR